MGVLTGGGDWATAVWETGLLVLMLMPVPLPNRGGWGAKRLLRLSAAARHPDTSATATKAAAAERNPTNTRGRLPWPEGRVRSGSGRAGYPPAGAGSS